MHAHVFCAQSGQLCLMDPHRSSTYLSHQYIHKRRRKKNCLCIWQAVHQTKLDSQILQKSNPLHFSPWHCEPVRKIPKENQHSARHVQWIFKMAFVFFFLLQVAQTRHKKSMRDFSLLNTYFPVETVENATQQPQSCGFYFQGKQKTLASQGNRRRLCQMHYIKDSMLTTDFIKLINQHSNLKAHQQS